jgi:ribosomal-protein-alanine N-acetyltransferase
MLTLETSRLILRPFTLDDAEAYFPLVSDPQILRYTGETPAADVDTAREILRLRPLRDYAECTFGRHAVIEKSSGELVGFSGLKRLPELDEVDVGYRFLPRCWGLGYATESAREAMRYGREDLGLARVVGLVERDNAASAHVLKKLGLKYERSLQVDAHATPIDLYA